MQPLNAANRQSVRAAEKAAKIADQNRGAIVIQIMSTVQGREYVWDELARANIFGSIFNTDHATMAFLEGERNAGLRKLSDIMQYCPEQFLQMMKEANQRRSEAEAQAPEPTPDPDLTTDYDNLADYSAPVQ